MGFLQKLQRLHRQSQVCHLDHCGTLHPTLEYNCLGPLQAERCPAASKGTALSGNNFRDSTPGTVQSLLHTLKMKYNSLSNAGSTTDSRFCTGSAAGWSTSTSSDSAKTQTPGQEEHSVYTRSTPTILSCLTPSFPAPQETGTGTIFRLPSPQQLHSSHSGTSLAAASTPCSQLPQHHAHEPTSLSIFLIILTIFYIFFFTFVQMVSRANEGTCYSGEKSTVTLEHSFCSTQKERGKDRASNHKNALESPMLQQLHLAQHQLWLHKPPWPANTETVPVRMRIDFV